MLRLPSWQHFGSLIQHGGIFRQGACFTGALRKRDRAERTFESRRYGRGLSTVRYPTWAEPFGSGKIS
ncbi:MAG: hypothetical protein ACKOC1_03725 [Hyphomicrobiales bacterium]